MIYNYRYTLNIDIIYYSHAIIHDKYWNKKVSSTSAVLQMTKKLYFYSPLITEFSNSSSFSTNLSQLGLNGGGVKMPLSD